METFQWFCVGYTLTSIPVSLGQIGYMIWRLRK